MFKKIIWISGAVLVVIVGAFLYVQIIFQFPETVVNGPIQEKRAVDFLESQPTHNQQLAQPPKEIIITSQADLRSGSKAYLTRTDARELGFGEGSATIDVDQRTLRYKFSSTLSPEDWQGTYTVTYTLCTEQCTTGQFQFMVMENGSEENLNT